MPGLETFKVKTLKHIAFLTGCVTATNKTAFVAKIGHHLHDASRRTRVLSVDMGIKNLAYCLLENKAIVKKSTTLSLHVKAWNKLDLLSRLEHDNGDSRETAGLFTPSSISRVAYEVTKSFLEFEPDIILIEQQRFRSGGGSAIQEWTVRVNMLESMLWACIETQRQLWGTGDAFPLTVGVSPARVAKFWYAGKSMSLTADALTLENGNGADAESSGKTKITKGDRISILQDWIGGLTDAPVELQFSGQAQDIVKRFATTKEGRGSESSKGKLDDLTDSLLQGAAWLKWQDNRLKVRQILDKLP